YPAHTRWWMKQTLLKGIIVMPNKLVERGLDDIRPFRILAPARDDRQPVLEEGRRSTALAQRVVLVRGECEIERVHDLGNYLCRAFTQPSKVERGTGASPLH